HALTVPDVHVPVGGADDDVEPAVAVEVGERGRADDEAVDRVGRIPHRVARVEEVHLDGEAGLAPAAIVPGVHLALDVGGHDVEQPVAIDVADGHRGEDGGADRRGDGLRDVGRRTGDDGRR